MTSHSKEIPMSETIAELSSRTYNKKELATMLFNLRNKVKRDGGQDPTIAAADQQAGQDALDRVSAITPEQMASSMTGIGVKLSNTIQQVTAEIIQSRNKLGDLEKACDTKSNELEELYGQEAIARSLGDALADHDVKVKEAKAKSQELDEELSRKEVSIERQKSELEGDFSKHSQRRQKEFEYSFAQGKQRVEDEFQAELKEKQITFEDEERERSRQWRDREIEMQKRETGLEEKESTAEAFEENLEAKAKKSEAITIASIKREYEHKAAIALNNATTGAAIASSTIETLSEQMIKQQTEIEALKRALATSQTEVGSIANKALESAAGRLALDSVLTQADGAGSKARRPS